MNLTDKVKSPGWVSDLTWLKTKANCKLPVSSSQKSPELEKTNAVDAQLLSSEVEGASSSLHRPVLDFDFPCELIRSSSGKNSHLYIGQALTHDQTDKLVTVLGEIGLLQPGVVEGWKKRGHLTVRPPWVKKGEDASWYQQHHPEAEQPKDYVESEHVKPEPAPDIDSSWQNVGYINSDNISSITTEVITPMVSENTVVGMTKAKLSVKDANGNWVEIGELSGGWKITPIPDYDAPW